MKIKLFKDNTQTEPDHEFESSEKVSKEESITTKILAVAQTGTHYVFGHKIAGEDSYAFFEAEVVTINFAIGFGPGRSS